MSKSRAGTRTGARELEPFARRRVDPTKFKPDLSPKDLQSLLSFPRDLITYPITFLTIDVLSVTKTVGRGRTNLTFIRPTIVQADAATPYAGFDRRLSPSRNPGIQMHFEPGAYGSTAPATYVMVFAIETFGSCTFNVTGYAGGGTLSNAGSKTVNGQASVSLVFQHVGPVDQVWGYVEQTSGNDWSFYSVRARFPALVIAP